MPGNASQKNGLNDGIASITIIIVSQIKQNAQYLAVDFFASMCIENLRKYNAVIKSV